MKVKLVICFAVFVVQVESVFFQHSDHPIESKPNMLDNMNDLIRRSKEKSGFEIHLTSFTSTPTQSLKLLTKQNGSEIENEFELLTEKFDVTNNQTIFDKFQSKLSVNEDIINGSLLATLCFISFLGNSCALVVWVFRDHDLGSAELFLVNLAFVDILLSVASYPFAIVAFFSHRWIFGELGCTIYGFICYLLGCISIYSITAVAVIRCLKTCHPAKGVRINYRMTFKIIAFGYLWAFGWSAVPLLGISSYEVEPFGLSCTLNWKANDTASRVYIVLVAIFLFFLPFCIILFSYIQIVKTVKRSNFKMQSEGVRKQSNRSDVQLTMVSLLVSTGFFVAWGPYTFVSLYSSFLEEDLLPMWATPVPVILAKSSIAFNPFIYIFFVAKYRTIVFNQVKRFSNRSQQSNQSKDCHGKEKNSKYLKSGKGITTYYKSHERKFSNDSSDSLNHVTMQVTTTTCNQVSVNLLKGVELNTDNLRKNRYKETQV